MRSFKSFEEALSVWSSKVPRKACDFVLRIWCPGWSESGSEDFFVPISDWTMPDVGIKFDNMQGLCHLQPTVVNPGTMEIRFVTLLGEDDWRSADIESANINGMTAIKWVNTFGASYDKKGPKSLSALWSTQFNKKGQLVFIPVSKRPHIALYRVTDKREVQVLHLVGCSFTYPTPTNMSQASTEVCQYSMQVSYCDIMQY